MIDLTVVKLLKAYVDSMEYHKSHPEKTIELTSQFTGVSRDVLVEAMKHFTWDYRVDLQARRQCPQRKALPLGFTKTDVSEKIPFYFPI